MKVWIHDRNEIVQYQTRLLICMDEEGGSSEVQTLLKQNKLALDSRPSCTLRYLETDRLIQKTIMLVSSSSSSEVIRQKLAGVLKEIISVCEDGFSLLFEDNCSEEFIKRFLPLFAECAGLVNYKFEGYKSSRIENPELKIEVITDLPAREAEDLILNGKNIAEGTNLARTLTNTPSDYMTPEIFSDKAREYAVQYGFQYQCMEEAELKEKGFGGILAVGQGSPRKPRLLLLTYTGNPADKRYIGIVGKGITFDAGGYCLKDSSSIAYMKVDMAGGAAVLGMICAAAQNRSAKNIIAAIPLCENLIGSTALIPGNIVKMYGGKTVEITNTDAEGRVVMADALQFLADREEVEVLLDIATLTGANATTFGAVCAGVLSSNDKLYTSLQAASAETGELIWRLPDFPAYRERILSRIADYRNSGPTKGAGTIVAGLFLKEFTNMKPWAHIDIAGPSMSSMPKGYAPAGATGFGARLLYEFITKW